MFQGNESIGGRASVESAAEGIRPLVFSIDEFELLFSTAISNKKARADLLDSKDMEPGKMFPILVGDKKHFVLIDTEDGMATDLSSWYAPEPFNKWLEGKGSEIV